MAETAGKVGKEFLNNLREKLQKGEFSGEDNILKGEGSMQIPSDISPEQLQELLESLKGQLGSDGAGTVADQLNNIGFGGMPGYAIHPAIFFIAFFIIFGLVGRLFS